MSYSFIPCFDPLAYLYLGMEESVEKNDAVSAPGEAGWYILGQNQEHIGPYAHSELQGSF